MSNLSKVSDLAVEFSKKLIKGKDYKKNSKILNKFVKKDVIEVLTDNSQSVLNRQKGLYFSYDIPFDPILLKLHQDILIREISSSLRQLFKKTGIKKPQSALIVGLGNDKLTADCFGDKVVNNIMVTRHATQSGLKIDDLCEVSAFSSSVFGVTGFESFDVIKGIVESVKPQVIILVDTLISSSLKRLGANIQMANVGIVPGSGVKNARKELSQNTLNTKVITIGMPFAIYVESINKNSKYKNMIVMPREIDEQLKVNSKIIASGINKALNPIFTKKQFETFFI